MLMSVTPAAYLTVTNGRLKIFSKIPWRPAPQPHFQTENHLPNTAAGRVTANLGAIHKRPPPGTGNRPLQSEPDPLLLGPSGASSVS
jgi:hypothetical protein